MMTMQEAIDQAHIALEKLAYVNNLQDHARLLANMLEATRVLGRSATGQKTAKAAILDYLSSSVGQVVEGKEIAAVSGITSFARRLRELRADGWRIVGGNHQPSKYELQLMKKHGITLIKNNQYALLSTIPQRRGMFK